LQKEGILQKKGRTICKVPKKKRPPHTTLLEQRRYCVTTRSSRAELGETKN